MNNLDNDYHPPKEASPFGTALKYGLIGGFALIVTSLIAYLLDMSEESWVRFIQFIVVVIVTVLAIKAHRDDDLNGVMSYGRGLGVGTLTGLIMSVIMAIYLYIFLSYIDTSVIAEQLANTRRELMDSDMSDDEIDQAMEMTSMFLSPGGFAIISIFMYTFIGFITSLIAAAFIKK